MKKILITGAMGQIGSELLHALQKQFPAENILVTDLREVDDVNLGGSPFERLDVLDAQKMVNLVEEYQIDTIFHLAALLSAVGEKKPLLALNVGINGTLNILETARKLNVEKVFIPSSIGAFGPTTPLDNTPQDTIQRPNTIYGITKVTGELLGDYYYKRFGVDCRGVRFPGLISYMVPPGGGTTDYAVEMFHYAVQGKPYTVYLKEDTSLDMMYMPDALDACINLMQADASKLIHRNSFNVTAMHFTPAELAAEIRKHYPDFTVSYEPDPVRQAIADSWPNYMDDSAARNEWGWNPRYSLPEMVEDMLLHIRQQYEK